MSTRKQSVLRKLIVVVAACCPVVPAAAACNAYFPFDGSLVDAGESAINPVMFGQEGNGVDPKFVEGRSGLALQLGTYGAVRAPIDLHPDRCPQVTIVAWVKLDASIRRGRWIVSTGSGHGPGIRTADDNLYLNGPANGLSARNIIRDDLEWMFVAGVWDFNADKYTLYWRTRSKTGEIGPKRKPPEEALWIGAKNEHFARPAEGVVIDDLRLIGRALGPEEVEAIRTAQ